MISDNRLYSALAIERSTFVYNFLVSILAMYTDLLYRNLSNKKLLEYTRTILIGLLCLVIVLIYVFY
jgi:hypothetical protein